MVEVSGLPELTKEEFLVRHPWARKTLKVIGEGQEWIAVNKPPGWLSIPDRWNKEHPNILNYLRRKAGDVYVVHRLDWQASGVNLFALGTRAHAILNIAFQYRAVRKVYLVLVEGEPPEEEGKIELKLSAISSRKKNVFKVDQVSGKPAVTFYRVLRKYMGYTLMQVEPLTGRTHQIRVHMKALGTPVAGDIQYAGHLIYASRLKHGKWKFKAEEEERPILERAFLHAWILQFPEPADVSKYHTLVAELPKDLKTVLRFLERYRRLEGDSMGMEELFKWLVEKAKSHALTLPKPLKYLPHELSGNC